MPVADCCCTVRADRSTLSHVSVTCSSSPEVSSIAFHAQPPDLPPVPLMELGFAVICPLARHRRPQIQFLSIGSRVCSTLRSEEHTSELQSQSNLGCRPLLEKKKTDVLSPAGTVAPAVVELDGLSLTQVIVAESIAAHGDPVAS